MRTDRSTLHALMPATRVGLLTATLMHPDRWWYLSELARQLDASPSSLQRDLAALTRAEILLRRQDGNRVYYRANPDCTLLPELQGLVAKTTGLVDVLRESLWPLVKRIEVATVFGSIARGDQVESSDVDLLVVGEVTLMELADVLPHAGLRLGRTVNPMLYSPDAFAQKVADRHWFLRTVLADATLDVIGSLHDLVGPAATEAGPAGPGQAG